MMSMWISDADDADTESTDADTCSDGHTDAYRRIPIQTLILILILVVLLVILNILLIL